MTCIACQQNKTDQNNN